MGYEKINEPMMVPSVLGPDGLPFAAGGGGTDGASLVSADASVAVSDTGWSIQKVVLTLTDFVMTVDATDEFEGQLLLTNPAGKDKILVGASAHLAIELSGGYSGGELMQVGIGTTEVAVAALTGTTDDIVLSATMGGSGLTGRTWEQNMGSEPGRAPMNFPGGNEVWLNTVSTGIATDGIQTITGTITLYYVEII